MADQSISCPKCGNQVSVTKAIGAEIETKMKAHYQKLMADHQKDWAQKSSALESEKAALAKQKDEFDHLLNEKLVKERSALESKLKAELQSQSNIELIDLKNQLAEKARQAESMQLAELELRKQKRELEERQKMQELELVRKFDAERALIEEKTAQRLTEEQRLKAAEKDKQLDEMRRQIEDLKRKAEQGSQQTQGEILEVEVEHSLRSMFPMDIIEPVAKGIRGGDIIQRVMTSSGQNAGTIIWETKRTKAWSDGWVTKLKEDQRAISAECAVIVTQVLPKGECHLALVDGVWAVDYRTTAGIAHALRGQLLQVYQARAMAAGKDEKLDFLYGYLTGTQFKQRVEAIVEAFQSMKSELEKEKRAYQRIWATREQQIDRVLSSTVGMYGDIQGIIGTSLPRIQRLELSSGVELLEE